MAVNTNGLSKGLKNARGQLGGFSGAVASVGVSIRKANDGIVTSFAKIGLGIQGITTLVRGVTSVLTAPLSLAANAEQTAVSFNVLTGSTEQAQKTLSELRSFAASTPLSFDEISGSAKKLISFGIGADDVTGKLQQLGDIGQGLGVPMSDLADMFGKAKVSGRLFADDLNQWQGRGVNLTKEFAAQFGVTEDKVRDLVSSGKVNFSHLETAITNLTTGNGQFAGLMAKSAGTLGGVWSTLKDNLSVALTEIGSGIADAFDLTSVTTSMTGFVQATIPTIKSWMSSFKKIVDAVKPIFVQYFNTLMASWNTFSSVVSNVFQNISGAVSGFLPSWESFRDTILTGLIAAEFAWTNWQTVVSIALKSTLASILGFAGQVQHTFTTVIPTFVLWLADNWREILGEMGRVGQLVFRNFANNVVNVISHIPDLIRGKVSFSNIWTPLTDEMALQFSSLPDIPERVVGEMESTLRKDVASMQSELSSGFQEFKADRMAQLLPQQELQSVGMTAGETVAKGMSESIKQVETGEVKLASTATFGSEAARSSILRHQLNVPDGDKELRDLNREQVSLLREQLKESRRQRQSENQTVTL